LIGKKTWEGNNEFKQYVQQISRGIRGNSAAAALYKTTSKPGYRLAS